MNRRAFLTGSLAMATTLPNLNAKDSKKMLPIIDTHQHLWDLNKFKLNWLKEGSPLGHSFTPVEYAKAIEGSNIVKSVYMEVDVVESQQADEANYLLELIESKKTTTVAAVVSGRPASAGFKAYVDTFKGKKAIKGIRQVIHGDATPAGYCLQKEFIQGIQYLGEVGLSFDICIRSTELADAAKLIDACPNTRFILDHCGNAPVQTTDRSQWQRDMETLGKKKNLVCKISGIIASAKKDTWKPEDLAPIIHHSIECFGWDRVLFASDWPVCTLVASLQEWINTLKQIVKDHPEEQQLKLFHDNAAKYYGI